MAPYNEDVELSAIKVKEDSLTLGSSYSMRREPVYDPTPAPGVFARVFESFKRDPGQMTENMRHHRRHRRSNSNSSIDLEPGNERVLNGVHYYDIRLANLQTSNTLLSRKLKGRHLQMIAIGGSIGTGLFVASGQALEIGGPASLLMAFSLVGAMLFCTCQALGELAVAFPVAGSFSAYSTRFLDPSWGFAMGWNYALQWLTVLPLEIIAASITITFWDPNITKAIFVTIFLIGIIAINLFGVKGYGEAEFIFSIIKIIAVIGFILLGIVLNCGGTPDSGYIGGRYWQDPGAFHNGFKGLCSVFVTAAFAFAGTEMVGLAAAETANPRKSLPTAIKQVFWRITLFYVVALTLIGLLVPYNEARLLGADSSVDATTSPFVIAIENARIDVLPSVMNAVILIAVLSVGNSAVFGSSRTLAALADQHQAPRFLSYVDRKGRPLMAIGLAGGFGLIAYLADLEQQDEVLDWLLAISGLSSVFTWASICLCHIRFRRAWALKGHGLHELAFRSQVGVVGSWCGLIMNLLVLVAQFWVGAFPVGWEKWEPEAVARNFFLRYAAFPIVVIMYVVHKFYFRTTIVRVKDMDVSTGRRDFNLGILVTQEQEERQSWPTWKRVYKFLC
ncbi:amino acid permease [Colletotrichum graminicola]|uniref:Amino acid permease n=1 Tax=Colletotrichum graminicola (strain M1.001 / M2 / FGSC 10212) TaxID=645133 RepID=E3QEH9_COLGM|nr:amino acid permease [Colletotrichum graminicola M1.001]EFQ29285.1 amino acid permease [Colletotrichum graminicola M1.001]WDK13705.1 amino acid permease [Colletotrichum graminicola]